MSPSKVDEFVGCVKRTVTGLVISYWCVSRTLLVFRFWLLIALR